MQVFAYIVTIIHIIIIVYTIFGCFLPINYLMYHILMLPIIYIQWELNDQRCILTDIESYLLNMNNMNNTNINDTNTALWPIIQKYINKYCHLTDNNISIILLLILLIGFIISLLRIHKYL